MIVNDTAPPGIVDGRAIVLASTLGALGEPRGYLLACYPKASIAPLDRVVRTAEPMIGRVNHGRWIASCSCGMPGSLPTPGCIVFLDGPWALLGWCVRCGNQGWGGGWRRIVVPPPEERARIEAVLLCRPNVEDRNWEPDETVADLLAQNREHGDPVPDVGDEPPWEAPDPAPTGPRWPARDTMAAVLAGLKRRRRGLVRAVGR